MSVHIFIGVQDAAHERWMVGTEGQTPGCRSPGPPGRRPCACAAGRPAAAPAPRAAAAPPPAPAPPLSAPNTMPQGPFLSKPTLCSFAFKLHSWGSVLCAWPARSRMLRQHGDVGCYGAHCAPRTVPPWGTTTTPHLLGAGVRLLAQSFYGGGCAAAGGSHRELVLQLHLLLESLIVRPELFYGRSAGQCV